MDLCARRTSRIKRYGAAVLVVCNQWEKNCYSVKTNPCYSVPDFLVKNNFCNILDSWVMYLQFVTKVQVCFSFKTIQRTALTSVLQVNVFRYVQNGGKTDA